MKLNEASPQQHLMIVIGAGACIFLNVITWYKAKSDAPETASTQPRVTQSIDTVTGQTSLRETKFTNPKLSWYESIFCRGIQRSSNCSYKLLHPLVSDPDEAGSDGEPKNNHVVYYRGNINKNGSLSRTVEAPEAKLPPSPIEPADSGE